MYKLISSYDFSDEHEGTQKKTFTKWINAQLAKVRHITTDNIISLFLHVHLYVAFSFCCFCLPSCLGFYSSVIKQDVGDAVALVMASALDSRSSGLGSSPGQCHCVVFLGKTLYMYFHSASLHLGTGDKMLEGNMRWTSIPSRGSSNTLTVVGFMLQKPR